MRAARCFLGLLAAVWAPAAQALPWEVREAAHPALGPIVFAMLSQPIVTRAGSGSISSNVYLSCERSTAKIAIELTNGTRPDDPGGMKPRTMPRLTCIASPGAKPEEIDTRWTANELGDVMARGIWPSTLRACASIGVSQEVATPPAWGTASARVQFEINPHDRDLDTIFVRCGEPADYPMQATPRAPAAAAQPPAASGEWIVARVTAEGHTNVRARPDIRSPLVIRLDPGDVVLVQRLSGDWWHARSRRGARTAFEGYIRRDRLVVK